MKIFDDILSDQSQTNLENLFLSSRFPWFLNSGTIIEDYNRYGYADSPQFIHKFIDLNSEEKFCSPYLDYVMENLDWENTLKKLDIPKYIVRMKSNLQLSTVNRVRPPHLDFDSEHMVMLYYVNDSDGPTKFYEKKDSEFTIIKEIPPKRGRFLVFNGTNQYHSSTGPLKYDKRCVINFNLADFEYES